MCVFVMKFLRNPEVKYTVCLYCCVGALLSLIAFVWDGQFGFLMLGASLIFLLLYGVSTYRRYQRIAELSADLNRILHGDLQVTIEKYAEGELGILQSELYKMTVRLREQQQNLQEDKIYLADSLADISHQIRTPLTSINLLVSFLAEPNLSVERRMKLTRELYEHLRRIEWLITALLKISKLDAGTVKFQREQIALEDLVRKAAAPLLVPMELRSQSLVIVSSGEFVGDVAWTCEALTNIVKNCMEHTAEYGKIEIQTTENPLFCEIVIRDNGAGIAKEDLPHIFERFYKGKDSDDKGFGIGLALARMIIIAQNGTVKAENLMTGGARFTVRFYKGTI